MDDHTDEREVLLAQLAALAKVIFAQTRRCLAALQNREEEMRLVVLQRRFVQLETEARDLGLDAALEQLYAPDAGILHPAAPPRKVSNPALDIFLATGLNLTQRPAEKKPDRARMALQDWP